MPTIVTTMPAMLKQLVSTYAPMHDAQTGQPKSELCAEIWRQSGSTSWTVYTGSVQPYPTVIPDTVCRRHLVHHTEAILASHFPCSQGSALVTWKQTL